MAITCGYARAANLPEGAVNFTTIGLKVTPWTLPAKADRMQSKGGASGRSTQVWDALARHRDNGKLIATFRTQMIPWTK